MVAAGGWDRSGSLRFWFVFVFLQLVSRSSLLEMASCPLPYVAPDGRTHPWWPVPRKFPFQFSRLGIGLIWWCGRLHHN